MEKVHIECSIAEVDNVVLGCEGAFQAYLEGPGPDGMNANGNQKFRAKLFRVLYFDTFSER
jgi:hypothetical protein